MKMKRLLIACSLFGAGSCLATAQATVRVEPSDLHGPRVLDQQTQTAAIRDYIESWKTMSSAFGQNQADLLDRDFVGSAKNKLSDTIQQQTKLGVQTRYEDSAHDLRILFYSPDGLSIELSDQAVYDVQIFDDNKPLAIRQVRATYIVVLTPAEVRWKVRVFQAAAE
jgi:hypothetical protein